MPSAPTETPSRAPIDEIREAVVTPFAVRAALQLDVFTPLADGPLTGAELADALGVKPRRLELLLYQLVVAKFLELRGDRFANTEMADYYLVKGRPNYFGGIHELWTELFAAQLHSAESIRTDQPKAKIDFSEMSQEQLGGFLRGVHGGAVVAGRNLAKRPEIAEAKRLADFGGGSGGVAIALCQEHPNLQVTIYDLPSVIPITRQMVDEAGLTDRIATKTANILDQAISEEFDMATARNLFQVLSPEDCQRAANNIADALPSGGVLLVIGHVCDDSRLSPISSVGMNMAFLNTFDDGQAYTESQYRSWLGDAGLSDIEREQWAQGFSLIVARKPKTKKG